MRTIIPLCIVLLFGCAAGPTSRVFDVAPTVTDEVSLHQFSVTYRNNNNKKVCLTPDNWPNSVGKVDQASSRVWATIEGRQYKIADFNTGYCPQCATKVQPGRTVEAKIPYSEFEIPEQLYQSEKSLHFQATAFFCK